MATVFRSKTDTWLVVILTVAMVASLAAASTLLSSGRPGAWWVAVFAVVIGAGLPLWLLLSTNYTLESRHLIVRSGPFRWRIALADTTGVTPSTNPLSSPALSLDRLRIDYDRGRSLMISPRDKAQFLLALEAARRAGA